MDHSTITTFLNEQYKLVNEAVEASDPPRPSSRKEDEQQLDTFVSLAANIHAIEKDLIYRRNRAQTASEPVSTIMFEKIKRIEEEYHKKRALIRALLEDDRNSVHQRIDNLRAEVNIMRENLNELRDRPVSSRNAVARDVAIAKSESNLRKKEQQLRQMENSRPNIDETASEIAEPRPTTGIKKPHLLFRTQESDDQDEDEDEQLPAAKGPTHGKGKPTTMAEANYRRDLTSSSSDDDEPQEPLMTICQMTELRRWLFRKKRKAAIQKKNDGKTATYSMKIPHENQPKESNALLRLL